MSLGVFAPGCTFYTNCPCANAGGTAGAPATGTGGSGTGGSSGMGGMSTGGTSGTAGMPVSNLNGPSPGDNDTWDDATTNLAGIASDCGNLYYVSAKPDEDRLIAGVVAEGLFESTDGGQSWSPIGTGKGSDAIANRPSQILYDPDDTNTFWETGIYGPGVFETTDDGDTFKELGDVNATEGLGIDFTDPKRETLLAGGHEKSQTLFLSTDGGTKWNSIGNALPSGTGASSCPLVIDSQNFLLGISNYGGTPGIFRSDDAGETWNAVSAVGGYRPPLLATDASSSIYWSDDSGGAIVRSVDQGMTWTPTAGTGADNGTTPVELPDKRIAVLGKRYVLVSADQGASWRPVSPPLPYAPWGLAYSSYERAFFIWHWTCDGVLPPVPSDAILRYDFDYETQ
ncbi:MAG TPA: hypothetical protein VMI54_08680 [Polyangiaceae bacterium]|nr:hypothetical protein [Polyangiaceae bacterium]